MIFNTASTITLIVSFFIYGGLGIHIGVGECNEMIKAIDCFPQFDKDMFNSIFSRLYDVSEVKLLQAKGLDFFGQTFTVKGFHYCRGFLEMISYIEKTLAYDIYLKTRGSGSRETSKLNHPLMVEKGWYDSLKYIRSELPSVIKTKCMQQEEDSTSQSSSTVKKNEQRRNENEIVQCINDYRRLVLRLSIANRLNNFTSINGEYQGISSGGDGKKAIDFDDPSWAQEHPLKK
jgi:hypothetical protein